MYTDMTKKLEFHKENIIREFIRHGVFPDDNMVQQKLKNIDMALAIFKHSNIEEGSKFNTSQYNKEVEYIYKDLCLLYELLQEVITAKYNKLQDFALAHLQDLENKARACELKVQEEVNTTSIGKTLLFKHNGFNIKTENNMVYIDAGKVNMNAFTKVACICDLDDALKENIVCSFSNDDQELSVSPYNYNQDTLIVPGSADMNNFTVNLNNNQIINGPVEMSVGNANANDQYIIFGGKDKVLIKSYSEGDVENIEDRPTDATSITLTENGTIDFYVVGGSKIVFWFNQKPVHANFPLNDYKVSNLKHIHHFTIDALAGFSMKFNIDSGAIYAVKDSGVIENGKLYFTGNKNIRSFYVERYAAGEAQDYNLTVRVYTEDGSVPVINSITVKELGFGGMM